jgi:hypothetical protein
MLRYQHGPAFGAVIFIIASLAAIGASVLTLGQSPHRQKNGLPYDWTHHHLIFSNPGSFEEAGRNGSFLNWYRTVNDFRYNLQKARRNAAGYLSVSGRGRLPRNPMPLQTRQDWSMNLGSGGKVGAGRYPAKYSFDTTVADCTNDFVVYNTGLAGSSTPTAATGTVTLKTNPAGAGWSNFPTVTIAATTYTFVASLTNINQVLRYTGGTAAANEDGTAQNLAAVVNGGTTACQDGTEDCVYAGQAANTSVTASASGTTNVATLTAVTTGAASNFTMSTSYSTGIGLSGGLNGTDGQATIVAYHNLYSGCTGTVPSVYWQYNTAYNVSLASDGSTATTSVVLSGDGSQVAFVQNNSSNVASLVLLRWAPNSSLVQLNTVADNVSPGNYLTCKATPGTPCMTTIPFSGSHRDTNSAPYYDYANDVIYVGDNSGVLHKFTGVLGGTPMEVTGGGSASGWPQTINAGRILTSPVYDAVSDNVFVGSGTGANGAKLHRIPSAGGSSNLVSSASLGPAGGTGIVDAPLVDSGNAGMVVYAFVGDDGSTLCTGGTPCSAVFQFPANFAASATGTEEILASGSTTTTVYVGTFDNTHYNGDGTTGNLYVCGGSTPGLVEIPMNAGFNGVPVTIGALTTGAAKCSPLTEFYDGSNDWMFFSVTANGSSMGTPSCAGACLYNYNISNALTASSNATAGLKVTGGSSGAAIDNNVSSSTLVGASQVYFSSLGDEACGGNGVNGNGTGGCAVQASQAGLQ